MGSYDTYESGSREPVRRQEDTPATPPRRARNNVADIVPADTVDAVVTSSSAETALLPTIVAIGGGLSLDRIVQKVPDEVKTAPLNTVRDYFLNQQYTDKRDITVVEAIRARMDRNDYRIIINGAHNLHNNTIGTRSLNSFWVEKSRDTDEGAVQKYNLVDLAIVSHDEGGK